MQYYPSNEQPLVSEGVLARLRAMYEALTEAEQRVADFIMQHPQETIHLSVQVLAQRMQVSEATIVRCCRSIGYHGLRDLKLALASESVTPLQEIHEDILPDDQVGTVTRKVLQSDIQAIADTLTVLDEKLLEQAVEKLLRASRIEFFGVGSSLPIAIDAYYRFLRIGLPAGVATDPLMQAISATHLPPGSVAFAISHSGRTKETLNALRCAWDTGAFCILLSSHANAPLSKYAHIQLVTSARETAFRTSSLTSRIAHLSVIDALYVAVAMRRSESSLAALERSTSVLDEYSL
ncbi:MurR/RpiR family transcriptional regulator [Ktedonosporobacter rubrisoli]|uniref:MurR/RpiR family transcriptional regulator n=1 Tax=Ktedonosporobacter rubrisoli TaxID=2509675 RepID=A0A4P6JMV9_KTERU|nr:MurR/RpiR family transcriptional regulator [Ktedonosporobacter rubrisoli]QBD76595.1 MurR/RpiR family transcriptional regulator [Ktedonosporobacter rubrisoli]